MGLRQKQNGPRRGLIGTARREMERPVPDEAVLDDSPREPGPEPERREPRVSDPRLRDLTFADWKAIIVRAFEGFRAHNAMMLASALAYASFFAIPSVLIVATGVFTLVASPETITSFIQHLNFIPADAKSLLEDSLTRASNNKGSSLAFTIIGLVLATWSVTGAMNAYMTALSLAYDRRDKRSFVRKRVVGLKMALILGVAFLLVAGLTMFGPVIERAIASRIGSGGDVLDILWWVVQWPILLAGLLVAFATLLYLGPDVEHRKWQFLTPGSLVAAVLWIAASALFAVYTATFASYNKTWGSLAAVIVMLTWLWITGMALLLGAEINAEVERSRELREA
jgi:membrane protein